MDITAITSLVGSLGFPICVAAWFMFSGKKATDANTEAVNAMAKAVENNTKAINHLNCAKLNREE